MPEVYVVAAAGGPGDRPGGARNTNKEAACSLRMTFIIFSNKEQPSIM